MFQKLEERIHKRLENLLDPAFEVKVIDFGLSKILKHGDFAQTPCGTLMVIAPEALEKRYDHRVDVWGIGLIAYMLLTT